MLKRLLRYRVAHGKLIPPEARVNAVAFPEAEYPVVCPKCRYLLRGLSDGPCPECGKPFDKGRLLVEQYVRERGMRFHPATARMSRWVLWLSLGVPFGGGLGFWIYARFFFDATSPPSGAVLPSVVRVWLVAVGLILVVGLVSIVLSLRIVVRYGRKTRQVFDAIEPAGARLPAQGEE